MFNYLPNGAIDECLLVDYQICKWGSPAEDLLFLITLSAAKDIRIKEFDHFVEIYYERLIECLQLLKFKRRLPKLRELQMSMYVETTSFYGRSKIFSKCEILIFKTSFSVTAFFAIYNHLMVILLPTDKDSNIMTMMRDHEEGDRFRMKALTNPMFSEAMKDILPFFYRRGIFNFEDYE